MVLRSSLPIEVRPREGLLLDAKNCRIGHMTRLVRVGALDLAFGEGRLSEQKNATGRYVLRLQRRTAQVQCSYVLVDVGPGGQDNSAIQDSEVVDRERSRERPLIVWTPAQNVLKCDANAQANPPRYLLRVQEDSQPGQDQALSLKVETHAPTEPASENSEESVVVIDRDPFLIAEVRYPAFRSLGTPEGPIVAQWASKTGTWDLLFEDDEVSLVLPPQTVGEQMVKAHEAGTDGNTALEFNFAPPTKLALEPPRALQTDTGGRRRRFDEAPWNLRRILGEPAQGLESREIRKLDVELLYGISCSFERPALRLTELFGRVGRIPPPTRTSSLRWKGTKEQNGAFAKSRTQWETIYRRYLSRLAVLEPWRDRFNDPRRPEPLLVASSSTCFFRVPPASNMALPFALPGVSSTGTLQGGAAYGFESNNVFVATVLDSDRKRLRVSDSATLSDLDLSSLGAWGRQMVGFQDNLTKIYGDIAMGRVVRIPA